MVRVALIVIIVLLKAGPVYPSNMDSLPANDSAQNLVKEVFLVFIINRIDAIDYERQTFEIDFYLKMWWKAIHSVKIDSRTTNPIPLKPQNWKWKPVNDFVNENSIMLLNEVSYVQKGKYIESLSRYRGVFFSDMPLSNFPFDNQVLKLKLEDFNEDLTRLKYRYGNPLREKNNSNSIKLSSSEIFEMDLEFPEYSISDEAVFTTISHYYGSKLDNKEFSQALLAFRIIRNPGYYLYKVLFVTLLLTLSGFLLFIIPPKDLSGRLAYGVTVMLAMISQNFAIQDSLPKISYLTVLDYIILASNLITFLILLYAILNYLQIKSLEKNQANSE